MRLGAIVVVAGALIGTAHAQDIKGDPAAGKKVATQICGQCHDVSGSETARKTVGNAPSFFTLAHSSDYTLQKIRRYVRLPHGSMINLAITGREADDVVSYVESLRRP